jgi:PhnB protein
MAEKEQKAMKPLTPYLFFAGNAREAMEFYKECFGGKLEVMTYADAPEDACPGGTKPTDETRDKVMHACLTTGDLILMASDNPVGAPVVGDNISISIQPKDIPETERLFNALSEGGEVTMPLADTFWGAHFGMLKDKYGFHWMLNCPLEK